MSRFLCERFRALEAYTPGEQPQDRSYIKLNTNESPYPPSEGVLRAVTEEEVARLRLYPDPTCSSLRDALADLYGYKRENILVSNGSDDILNFAFLAFAGRDGVVFPDISYGFYKVYAELHGAPYTEIPLCEDFSIDPSHYCKTGKNVVIANPNAPTGLALPLSDVERIVKENPDHVVLIDEAYVDFGAESAVSLVGKYENLLVVRTFSKSASLAGARLGFAVGSPDLIADLEKIKYSTNPYSLDRLTLLMGTAAVRDADYYRANCRRIIASREKTIKALCALGFTVTDSKANFVFAASDKLDGETLYNALREKGVLVRHFSKERIRNYNRITIGSEEETDTFLRIVTEILNEGANEA